MFAVLPCIHADDLSDADLDVLCEDTGADGDSSFTTTVCMLQDVIDSNTADRGDDDDDDDAPVLKPYINDILAMPDDTVILVFVSMEKIKVVDKPIPAEYSL